MDAKVEASNARFPMKIRSVDQHLASKRLKRLAELECAREIEQFAICTSQTLWVRKCKEALNRMNDCLQQASNPERYAQFVNEQATIREALRDERINRANRDIPKSQKAEEPE